MDAMQTFLDSAQAISGPRRDLTPEEEENLKAANKLWERAERLRKRARKLRKRARKLEPPNLYPDSLLGRYIAAARLHRSVGPTFSIPKFDALTAAHFTRHPITEALDQRAADPDGTP